MGKANYKSICLLIEKCFSMTMKFMSKYVPQCLRMHRKIRRG